MIEQTMKLGVFNSLKIARVSEPGYYLQDLDENEVLLPNRYIKPDMNIDDEIIVFLYTDSDDRLVATTEIPKGCKDQFVAVKVVDTTRFGAFVDIGLTKDLFVPKNRQKRAFEVGQTRIVRIIEDEQTNRLVGVEKITSFLEKTPKDLVKNQEVKVLVFAKTDLGFKVIVEDKFEGLIYANEIFQKIYVGDMLQAFIKNIRPDGKLDISLQPIGKKMTEDRNTQIVLEKLKNNNGTLPYNYKTEPEVVQEVFSLSKKAYKKALTSLNQKNVIQIDENGMKLV